MSTKETCPRCQGSFACQPGNVEACDCNKLKLSKEEYRYINEKYSSCLCNNCLNQLREEHSNNIRTKPLFFGKRPGLLLLLSLLGSIIKAQVYPPGVGQPGSTAMYKDSSAFVAWATGCKVTRGYQDISNPGAGYVTAGDSSMALGKAMSNGVVSLGDRGSAVCVFQNLVSNGPGFDFAVFENSFDDSFLELAFVEVSSDGQNFFRFPAHSLTDTTTQTGSFGSTDATKINHLAGKYRGGYGAPFDLQVLAGTSGLNINAVTHVRVIDVVGSINNAYASRDAFNNKINDPWPTAFPSGGFDLDAIGVIHEAGSTGMKEPDFLSCVKIYPNPAIAGITIILEGIPEVSAQLLVYTTDGALKKHEIGNKLLTEGLVPGIYSLEVRTVSQRIFKKLIIE